MQREPDRFELLLGDGILSWRCPKAVSPLETVIHHPLILIGVELTFDPQIPEFRVINGEASAELYGALFRAIPETVDAAVVRAFAEAYERQPFEPLEADASVLFERMVHQLDTRGRYLGVAEPGSREQFPQIGRAPAIFCRARTAGFAAAIESVLDDIEQRIELPSEGVEIELKGKKQRTLPV